jgi:hypothetical protein
VETAWLTGFECRRRRTQGTAREETSRGEPGASNGAITATGDSCKHSPPSADHRAATPLSVRCAGPGRTRGPPAFTANRCAGLNACSAENREWRSARLAPGSAQQQQQAHATWTAGAVSPNNAQQHSGFSARANLVAHEVKRRARLATLHQHSNNRVRSGHAKHAAAAMLQSEGGKHETNT